MRQHAGSSFLLSLLIVTGFAVVLFPDEKGLKAVSGKARSDGFEEVATPASRKRPASSDFPPPTTASSHPARLANTPSRSSPAPVVASGQPERSRRPNQTRGIPAVPEPYDFVQPRATLTASARPSAAVQDRPDEEVELILEPVELPAEPERTRPLTTIRKATGSWQPGPAARAR